jgi:hypothetical protein
VRADVASHGVDCSSFFLADVCFCVFPNGCMQDVRLAGVLRLGGNKRVRMQRGNSKRRQECQIEATK